MGVDEMVGGIIISTRVETGIICLGWIDGLLKQWVGFRGMRALRFWLVGGHSIK